MTKDYILPRLWRGPAAPPLRALFSDAKQRKAWIRYWLRDTLAGLGDLALHYGLRIGTLDSCSWVGAQIGRHSAPRNHPDWHARAAVTLARLRPDLDEAERERLLDRRWANLGRTMCEFSVLDRFIRPGRVAVDGAEFVHAARAAGQPVILAAVHLGNWEVIGTACEIMGVPLSAIYQPPRSRFRHWIAVRARARARFSLIPPGQGGALPATRALRRGKALFMGIDEYVDGRVHAPFFGRPYEARGNIANAVRLARMTGAAVLPCWVERVGTQARFIVHMLPPVALEDIGSGSDAVVEGVRRIDAAIAPVIRANLDHWLMLHEFRFDR